MITIQRLRSSRRRLVSGRTLTSASPYWIETAPTQTLVRRASSRFESRVLNEFMCTGRASTITRVRALHAWLTATGASHASTGVYPHAVVSLAQVTASFVGQSAALVAAGFAAGAVNSVAGGGTLLTFPALLAVGLGPVAANATSTIALVPGSAAAFWGYRDTLTEARPLLVAMAVPSALGGVLGAWLTLRAGDALFAAIVPWLLLGATALFLSGGPVSAWVKRRGTSAPSTAAIGSRPSPRALGLLAVAQFAVSVYGGFFGAGMGIVMLAALTLAGMTDVHRMNGLKNAAAVCINGVAALTFVRAGAVRWPQAFLVALGAVAGGYGGAGLARRVGPRGVRAFVGFVGLSIAAVLLVRARLER